MKKTAYILAAAVLVATMAGCNSNSGSEEPKGGKVTQIAFQADSPKEDTTEEALTFLKEQVPLFSKYLETRMQYPLTFETETEVDGSIIKAAMYIKDESTACYEATDSSGYTNRNIYSKDMLYVIEGRERMIYTNPTTEEAVKENIAANLLTIDADEAKSFSYVCDYDYFNDVLYKHEIIYNSSGAGTRYFFDENPEELVYIVTNEQTTKITKLKNEVDESVFELPSDYGTMDLNEYYNEYYSEHDHSTCDHDHSQN